ncbi:MAG: hypothetical protein CXT75_10740 [Methanobacteriota archaeon]|nr:MAG: hypothetical protein CXT75_10740 [Euryarchaeota archaeon]
MDSIVLAGGFAKRMLPLTEKTPKQLLDVAGKPMLSHVLHSLESVSPDRVIVSVNSFFAPNFNKFVESYEGPLNLQLFVESSNSEDEKLGALGALNLLFTELSITGPVIIAGGDNLSDFDLSRMLTQSDKTQRDVELAKLYGIAEIDGDRIVDFIEKPAEPESTLAATAYWLLSEDGVSNFFEYINSGGDRDALGNFLAWNVRRNDVRCVSFRGNWYDIGDLESYKAAQKWLTN